MRGYMLILFIFGWLPAMLFKPHVGVLVWDWISHMIPQATSEVTRNMQILDAVAALTIIGLFISKEPRKVPAHPILWVMLAFFIWSIVITAFGYNPSESMEKFIKFFKVILFVFITAIVMQSPLRLKAYYWVMALGMGFYAIKGGLFTIQTAGSARVQGPGGMFTDNNQFALALSMMIPVAYYLFLHPPMKFLRWPMFVTIFLTFISVVGTNSRGGLVAGVAVMGMLFLNMRRGKLLVLLVTVPGIMLGWQLLPDNTKARYATIFGAVGAEQTAEDVPDKKSDDGKDESFKGRVVMWKYAANVVSERPLIGGGFEVHYLPETKDKFLPANSKVMAWHSIYFEVLGEMGYVGLFLFLTLIFTAWFSAGSTYRQFKQHPDLMWLADMAKTLRLSLVGYCVAGLTVNVSTLDLMYDLCMLMALTSIVGNKILTAREEAAGPKAKFGSTKQQPALVGGGTLSDDEGNSESDKDIDEINVAKFIEETKKQQKNISSKKKKWSPHDP